MMLDFSTLIAIASMLSAFIVDVIFQGFPLLSAILFWFFYLLGFVVVLVDAWQYRKLKRIQ